MYAIYISNIKCFCIFDLTPCLPYAYLVAPRPCKLLQVMTAAVEGSGVEQMHPCPSIVKVINAISK
jgi:hypothetical protein